MGRTWTMASNGIGRRWRAKRASGNVPVLQHRRLSSIYGPSQSILIVLGCRSLSMPCGLAVVPAVGSSFVRRCVLGWWPELERTSHVLEARRSPDCSARPSCRFLCEIVIAHVRKLLPLYTLAGSHYTQRRHFRSRCLQILHLSCSCISNVSMVFSATSPSCFLPSFVDILSRPSQRNVYLMAHASENDRARPRVRKPS